MSKNIVLTSVNERGIAEVILNRPEKNNAYNGDMIIELIKSFETLYQNNLNEIIIKLYLWKIKKELIILLF